MNQSLKMQPNNNQRPISPNRTIDTTVTGGDNDSQDGYFERIDRREMTPMNDTECTHERYVKDPSDETEEYVSMVCANSKCPVGYLLAK